MKKVLTLLLFFTIFLSGCANNNFLNEEQISYYKGDVLDTTKIEDSETVNELLKYLNTIQFHELDIESVELDSADKTFYSGVVFILPNNNLMFAISDNGTIYYTKVVVEENENKVFYASNSGHKENLFNILNINS